jgi:hypothetical protein
MHNGRDQNKNNNNNKQQKKGEKPYRSICTVVISRRFVVSYFSQISETPTLIANKTEN